MEQSIDTPEKKRVDITKVTSSPRTSVLAVTGLVMAFFLMALFFLEALNPLFLFLIAIFCFLVGLVALVRIWRNRETLRGSLWAIVAMGPFLFFVLLTGFIAPNIMSSDPEFNTRNDMLQFATAIESYKVDKGGHFPSVHQTPQGGALSWRVQILPKIGCQHIYEEFHLDEDWDSEHNRELISRMPSLFCTPEMDSAEGKAVFCLPVGPGTLFGEGKERIHESVITDYPAKTILMIEVAPENAVIWTKPEDWTPRADDPFSGLRCRRWRHYLVVYTDQEVATLPKKTDPEIFRQLLNPNDGLPETTSTEKP